MSDLDLLVMDALEDAVPYRREALPDWPDALARAGVQQGTHGHVRPAGDRPVQRRPVWLRRGALPLAAAALAAAVVAVATPAGSAVVRGIGDFSAWLRGVPGEPVGPAEQEAFERANRRVWSAFPDGPQLSTLIEREVEGRRFELQGFRSGGSLCLRLLARGLNGSPAVSCAPLQELQGATAPALVVLADHSLGLRNVVPVGQQYVAPEASATFGIVADGVTGVELVTDEGTRRAVVEANAFLSIDASPELGERVRAVFASARDGRRVEVPFVSAPFGSWDQPAPRDAKPTGPAKVERTVAGGRVGWLERREPRGVEPPADAPYMRGPMGGGLEFARLLAPDPQSHLRLLVGIGTLKRYGVPAGEQAVCYFLVAGGSSGGGCSPLDRLFPRAPFSFGQSLIGGGHQFETISGLASDEVARLEIFFATGERRPIPLADNAFIVQAARAKYPIRLVAYDAAGQIIGIETREGDAATYRGPRPVGAWRTVLTVEDEQGNAGRLRVARSSGGGRCYEYLLPGGAGGSGCDVKTSNRPKLGLGISQAAGSAWLAGDVVAEVAEVELHFADGATRRLRPTERFILAPVDWDGDRRLTEVVGFDAAGDAIARQRFRPPQLPGG